MTEELSRVSALAGRHRALGSLLEDWNGMGTAWTYDSDPRDEHNAIRECAGMLDMSGLKKVHIHGPDATRVVDHVMTRNMRAIYPGKCAYGPVLTDQGTVCDDAIAYNNGDHWLLLHGSGESMERLEESAAGNNASLQFDDDLHNISLQGPLALKFLAPHTPIDLPDLKYFHHCQTELFGYPCLLSRTGYSGERGYEILVSATHAVNVWDHIAGEGRDHGIIPCSFTSLDIVRIEAALLFFGYDMTAEHFPWEVGLGWAVSPNKEHFRGRDAAFAQRGKERFNLAGLVVEHDAALAGGEELISSGKAVGVVNSPAWSSRLQQSLALVHLSPEHCRVGTEVTVHGEDGDYPARVSRIPFYDPQKKNTHA